MSKFKVEEREYKYVIEGKTEILRPFVVVQEGDVIRACATKGEADTFNREIQLALADGRGRWPQ